MSARQTPHYLIGPGYNKMGQNVIQEMPMIWSRILLALLVNTACVTSVDSYESAYPCRLILLYNVGENVTQKLSKPF